MASVLRLGMQLARSVSLQGSVRAISVTAVRPLKEIHVKKDGDILEIMGVTVPSPRAELLVTPPKFPAPHDHTKQMCYMCALSQEGLDVKHTDVLILSQFVRTDGCMLPRRITGLCKRMQKKIGKMVTMAQKAGLMINLTPANCNKNPRRRRDYKKFNTYFDEATIFAPKPKPWFDKMRRCAPHVYKKEVPLIF